jgi:Putative undecaprenyl diphosphate synthase
MQSSVLRIASATQDQASMADYDWYVNSLQGCPQVDLMIRTSGETRLSDFMLPQSSHATLCFSAALWPDFSFLDMLGALAQYQRDAPTLRQNALAAQQRSADSGPAQPVSQLACSEDCRHDAAASAAAHDDDSMEAEQHRGDVSGCSVSPGEHRAGPHALRRRHPAEATACEQHPGVPPMGDGSSAAGEGSSQGAAMCRAASRGKIGMQTLLQFDVLANSTAPALISN